MKDRNKKIILAVSVVALLLVTLGITYAAFTYSNSGGNQELVVGDIYMHYKEGEKQISIPEALPSATYNENEYFEFTIDGNNTYTEKDIWYEIDLDYGDKPLDVNRTERIKDELLKFTLIGTRDGVSQTLLDGVSYGNLEDRIIWVDRIPKGTDEEIKITYKLYMWISDETIVGNVEGADYSNDVWNDNVYASIKVNVKGDFNKKEATLPIENIIKNNVGTNGIVAIDNSGDSTEATTNVREYRYSGKGNYCKYNDGETDYELQIEGTTCPKKVCVASLGPMTMVLDAESDELKSEGGCEEFGGKEVNLKEDIVYESGVNNYIKFNDEMWRIVGLFGKNLKIVRATAIDGEVPEKYTPNNGMKYEFGIKYDGSDYGDPSPANQLKYKYVMYNGVKEGSGKYGFDENYEYNPNDWTHAGLQYYLNEEQGYLGSIQSDYKKLLQEETYYLGNVSLNNSTYIVEGTAKEVYNQERGSIVCGPEVEEYTQNSNCNIWNGNQATWKGKVSLLYPSDYMYASDKSYWSTDMGEFMMGAIGNDWLNASNAVYIWFLSPASVSSYYVLYWVFFGGIFDDNPNHYGALRPVVNISASTLVTGKGTYDEPFVIELIKG